MIGPSTLLLACAAGLLVGFQDPDDGLPPLGLPAARPHTLVPGGTAVVDTVNASVGGLPAGSNVEVLTWDRAYALALIRARSAPAKGTKGVAALDRAWLDRESQRLDIRDFARFRGEFLASPPAFRDPAPRYSSWPVAIGRPTTRPGTSTSTNATRPASRSWSRDVRE